MNIITTASNQQDEFPSVGRAVLVVGLAGLLFANLASQVGGTHLAAHSGIALSTTDTAWISAAYTMASFVGLVAAEALGRTLGVRRYFVGSALLLAAFGWLQATVPSVPVLLAMRTFEGFTTGGFGPKAFLAAFMLYNGRRATPALSAFLLLVSAVVGLVMFGASESVLGLRGLYLVQSGLSAILVVAGLRWLPHATGRRALPHVTERVIAQHSFILSARGRRMRRSRCGHRRTSTHPLSVAVNAVGTPS